MAMSGPKYAISKEGLIKLLVIAFGCVTFALLIDTGFYDNGRRMTWVFAAFVVSCAVSFLFYIFRITGLSDKMGCGGPCTFDGIDFLWSWFCTIWCLAAAIVFAVDFPSENRVRGKKRHKLIASVVFAFATAIMYAVEAHILRIRAPANIGYISTMRGWLKTIIVAFGAATFALLVDTGYAWCGRHTSCYAGITYALVAFVVGWGITVLIWIGHLLGLVERKAALKKIEFIWSIICVLLFWSGAACFAAFMQCRGKDFERRVYCQKRLSGVIIGFVTGILYIVDAILNRH